MIRPLSNQILIRILPREYQSPGDIEIPEAAKGYDQGEKQPPVHAIVLEVGPWKRTKRGLAVLPEVKKGDRILIDQYHGQRLNFGVNTDLRLVKSDDVLAVLETVM